MPLLRQRWFTTFLYARLASFLIAVSIGPSLPLLATICAEMITATRSIHRYYRLKLRRNLVKKLCGLSLAFVLGSPVGIALAAEKPQLTRLNPSGIQINGTTNIAATGTFKDWPVQVWCSVPGITWKCTETAGTFEVSTTTDVQPGIGWVRFYNEAGTTPAKPFVVSSGKVVLEKDPNDKVSDVSELLEPNTWAFGSIDRSADADHFRIKLKKGEPIYAVVDSARSLKSPLDAHLQLLNIHGHVLTENLDSYGYDPAIEYTPVEDGDYFLRIFGFPIEPNSTISFQGGGDWCYAVRWNSGTRPWTVHNTNVVTDHLPPEQILHSTKKEEAKDLPLETPLVQILNQRRESHFYKLPAKPGAFFKFTLRSQSMGSPLDPTLAVIDKTDKQIAQVDDVSTNRDPELVWQMPSEGEFWLKVSDFHNLGGERHAYHLVATEQMPSLEGNFTAESYQGKAGNEVEIGLNVKRIANWTGECEVQVTGLPEGAELLTSKLPITAETPAAQTLKIKVPAAWQGPLLVSLKAGDQSSNPVWTTNGYSAWLQITP